MKNTLASHPKPRAAATRKRPSKTSAAKPSHDKPLDLNVAATFHQHLKHELDVQKVPETSRPGFLALMTKRSAPTCRRWLAKTDGGLPDLESFARLCVKFELDANYFLGLTDIRFTLPAQHDGAAQGRHVADAPMWVTSLSQSLGQLPASYVTAQMSGDEMEPRIADGEVVFFDPQTDHVQGNGTYYFEFKGRRLIRNIEDCLAGGYMLSCENKKYSNIQIPSGAEKTIKILGRVRSSIAVRKF